MFLRSLLNKADEAVLLAIAEILLLAACSNLDSVVQYSNAYCSFFCSYFKSGLTTLRLHDVIKFGLSLLIYSLF